MKLIIIIPAYNEEQTIGDVIREIPKSIKNIDSIKILLKKFRSVNIQHYGIKKFPYNYFFKGTCI